MPFYSLDDHDPTTRLEYHPTGGVSPFGRPLYCVVGHSIRYVHPRHPKLFVTVQPGFVTDLATIPNYGWLPNPAGSLWDDAAIVHDVACREAFLGTMTYREADSILYYSMRERGCAVFTALSFWTVCRIAHIYRGKI